jgi:hypothetical protein
MYFEQMLFRIPQTPDCTPSSNYSPMTDSNGEEDTNERREDERGSSGVTSTTYTFRKQQHESNTAWKINFELQLLDILKEKSGHIDEDTTFLSLVPAFKTPEWRPEVLGRDRNAGHYKESQKYGVSATVHTMCYHNNFFTTDIWV